MRGLQSIVSRSSEVNNSRLTSNPTRSPSSMLCSFRKNVAAYSLIRCRKKSDPRTPHGSLFSFRFSCQSTVTECQDGNSANLYSRGNARQRINETKHWPAKTSYEPKSGEYSLSYFPELKGEFRLWAPLGHQTRRKPLGLH